MRGQPQVVDLGRPARQQHLLDQGQGPGRIEVVEGYRHALILIEYMFDYNALRQAGDNQLAHLARAHSARPHLASYDGPEQQELTGRRVFGHQK